MDDHDFGTLTAVRLTAYARAEQDEILGDGTDPFGVAGTGLTWLPKEVHFGVRSTAGRLVAHAGLLRLPVAIDGSPTEVIGVGGVAVAPDLRGRGLARTVLTAALDHARTMGPRHALLFCRPPLVALYDRLGWRELTGDVQVEQPAGPVVMPLRTMWTPLEAGPGAAPWPAGDVRVLSFPM
ncbi:GNAT family N-acetyltransferase [Streptomyces flavofungini]|uniref:GNAT family N-acetyltransferase n=1 Tax=Streptomyces flavofungini TaxID=68200 RepID=UPI0025AF9E82|nr:GNAT family N-acetyltransferase [Streptomyces flavofungini]WJV50191.1 GNAT family N-acetyltransferase [Streptomyces flavofungini]